MARKIITKKKTDSKHIKIQPAQIHVKQNHKRRALLFIMLFTIQIILFYVVYGNQWFEQHLFFPLANTYAWISGKVLSLVGYSNIVAGDIISSATSLSVSIKKGCDAAEPMAIFIAAVIAFPATYKSKFSGLLFGLLMMFLLNIVRIFTLFIAGVHFPDFFETMHLAVWQVLFIMFAIMLWVLWIKLMVKKTT
jgi:exosortase H (IPTLxxWG-CTERM-specific)